MSHGAVPSVGFDFVTAQWSPVGTVISIIPSRIIFCRLISRCGPWGCRRLIWLYWAAWIRTLGNWVLMPASRNLAPRWASTSNFCLTERGRISALPLLVLRSGLQTARCVFPENLLQKKRHHGRTNNIRQRGPTTSRCPNGSHLSNGTHSACFWVICPGGLSKERDPIGMQNWSQPGIWLIFQSPHYSQGYNTTPRSTPSRF